MQLMVTYEPDAQFPFQSMSLADPQALQGGGAYFTRLTINAQPVTLQFPQCLLKNGVVTTSRSKYADLMYPTDDSQALLTWIESIEVAIKKEINKHKSTWFSSDLTMDDLDTMLNPVSRFYMSEKKFLVRAFIDSGKRSGADACPAFDEQQRQVSLDSIEAQKDAVIPLVTIEGVKFSSRSFQIEVKLSQVMKLDRKDEGACKIKISRPEPSVPESTKPTEETFLEPPQELPEPEEISEVSLDQLRVEDEEDDDVTQDSSAAPSEYDSEGEEEERPTLEITESVKLDGVEDVGAPKVVSNGLEEVDLQIKEGSDPIELRKPNEVYYEIYRAARERAKHMRKVALEAFLEAKQIKSRYMLTDIDDSDDSDLGSEPSFRER
jgi:hypothetical protein